MKYAYIENNTVREVVQSNPFQLFGPGYAALFIEAPDEVQQGWVLDNGTFTPPVPVQPTQTMPQVVTRAQFILALLEIGLLDEVEAAIAGADRATQINYSQRLEFERSYPLVATMAAVLGKTDAEIDALFVLAATK